MRKTISRPYRWLLLVQVFALILTSAPVSASPTVLSSPERQVAPVSYEYDACRDAADKETLRSEIARLIGQALENPETPLDVEAIVTKQWDRLGVDAVIDDVVDQAIKHLEDTEPWHLKAASAWGPPVAEAYAKLAATEAFSSPTFQSKMEELSKSVAEDITQNITAQFERAASVGLRCLEEYAGAQYSKEVFARALENVIIGIKPGSTPLGDRAYTVPIEILIPELTIMLVSSLLPRLMREIGETLVGRIAGNIAERILGKGATSLLPAIGWVIALAMLAYDLWQAGKGAFPQIREALQSPEAKAQIRNEVIVAVQESLPGQVDVAAFLMAAKLVDKWDRFCLDYAGICQLKEKNARFAGLVKESKLAKLVIIRDVVQFYREELGENELLASIDSYNLDKVVEFVSSFVQSQAGVPAGSKPTSLQAPIISLLRDTHDTAVALQWAEMADGKLSRLIDYGVHRSTAIEEWDGETLIALLTLPKARDIQKLLNMTAEERRILLSLPSDQMKAFVTNCTESQLSELSGQMLTTDIPPERIAKEAVDCAWKNPQPVVVSPPSASPTMTSTAAAPNVTPSPSSITLSLPDTWSFPAVDIQWSILAFVLVGLALEVAFVGRKLAQDDRKQQQAEKNDKNDGF